jgi:hypothetical protein
VDRQFLVGRESFEGLVVAPQIVGGLLVALVKQPASGADVVGIRFGVPGEAVQYRQS